MKKMFLTAIVALACSNVSMAQSGTHFVKDIEAGRVYLTNIKPTVRGGVEINTDGATVVSEAEASLKPGKWKVVTGPSQSTSYPNGTYQKACYNTNNWPCMLVKIASAI